MFATILAGLMFSALASAQDTSTTSSAQTGQPTVTTEVKSGEVVYVSGNDLVVKTDDGQVKHFTVPDDVKFNVDGKDLTVHDLTPGMRLIRTMTTTSVPKNVRTVRTINGTVWYVNPPSTVILTLPDNTNKRYTVPRGQMFEINGENRDVFHLRKGMKVTATVISESPGVTETSTRSITGQAPPPPPETPPATGALLIEEITPVPPPSPQVAQATLPQTGSMIPLLGLLGLICVGASFALRMCHE